MTEELKFDPIAEDTSSWKPLPAEITAKGGTPPRASDILPPSQPPLYGTPVASEEQTQANIIRYGVPVAVGLATGGAPLAIEMLAGGISSGLSEITARQLERAGTDPELSDLWNDLKAGGLASALDAGATGVLHGFGKMFRAVAKKALPKEMPPDIEMAQTILGKLKNEKSVRKWYQFKGKNDPFSLSLGQLNNEERGFVTWLEGIARGGTGKGIMSRFDARNEKHVAEALEKYFAARTTQMTAPEFGVFMKRILGEVNDPGQAFKPVEAFKAFLYDQYEQVLADLPSDVVIDGTNLRNFIRKSADTNIMSIFGDLRTADLVPPLEGISTNVKRATRTTTKRSVASTGTTVADTTKTNLLDPDALPKRTYTATEAERAATGENTTVTETLRELIADPRKTAAQVDEAWQNLTPVQVDKIIRVINKAYSKSGGPEVEALNNRIKAMRYQISPELDKAISTYPELVELRRTAESYFGQKQDALYNAAINSTRKALSAKPSAVVAMYDPLKGSPAEAYDRLMALKKGLYFSAATPEFTKASGEVISGQGKKAISEMYHDSIIKPLRFRFVNSATDQYGRLDPSQLLKNIEAVEREAPEMLNELWGSPAQVKYIKEFASTYQTLFSLKPERNIFIQLKTAGAVSTLFTAGAAPVYFNSDSPQLAAGIGAATVLLSPILLAKVFSNPTLIRSLTDGVTESAKTGGIGTKLAMTFRKLAQMKVVSNTFRDNLSTDAMQFYNFEPIEDTEARKQASQ